MHEYIHKVHYYETDKMGITHHSNYIRWLEEARTDFLDRHGYGYAKMETYGITSPVISAACQYKQSTTFDDEIRISVSVQEYTGVKFVFCYTLTNNKTDVVVATARTEHCFIDENGRPIIIKKKFAELDAILKNLASNS